MRNVILNIIRLAMDVIVSIILGIIYVSMFLIPCLVVIYFSKDGFSLENVAINIGSYVLVWLCYCVGRYRVVPYIMKIVDKL